MRRDHPKLDLRKPPEITNLIESKAIMKPVMTSMSKPMMKKLPNRNASNIAFVVAVAGVVIVAIVLTLALGIEIDPFTSGLIGP